MLVHFHSFVFLALSFLYVYNATLGLFNLPDWVFIVPNVAVTVYIPVYLYKALRRVYTQGRLTSIFKYLLLLFGYLVGTLLVALVMIAWIALTY